MVGKCKGEVRYLFSRHVAFANKSLGQCREEQRKLKSEREKNGETPFLLIPHAVFA